MTLREAIQSKLTFRLMYGDPPTPRVDRHGTLAIECTMLRVHITGEWQQFLPHGWTYTGWKPEPEHVLSDQWEVYFNKQWVRSLP